MERGVCVWKRLKRGFSGSCCTENCERELSVQVFPARFPEWEQLFLLYMLIITQSTKKLLQISVAPLKVVRPHQCTAAEDLGLVVWSCLFLARHLTRYLMLYSSPCFHMPGSKNWVWGGFDCSWLPSQVFPWSSTYDHLHVYVLRYRMNTYISYSFQLPRLQNTE